MGWFGKKAREEEPPDERGKVFTWAKEKRVWLHLTAFLLFSALIHGSGFYLFKVVYPTPVRVHTKPNRITILEPNDPAVRSLLQRLSDRTTFLLPPSASSNVRVRLVEQHVHFTPAFQRTELELAPPPSLVSGPGHPLPLPSSGLSLPSNKQAGAVNIKLDPKLANRPYAPWSLLHDYLTLADSLPLIRFSIKITPGGEVTVVNVEAPLDEEAKHELTAVLESTLRFVPASKPAAGWIEIGGL